MGSDVGAVVRVTPTNSNVPPRNVASGAEIDAFVVQVEAGTAPGPKVRESAAVAIPRFFAELAAAQARIAPRVAVAA